MPRTSRSRIQLSEEEKKRRRREQKKLSIRRARAKMDEAALEERRKQDRERYRRKKEQGKIKSIRDYSAREQRQIRKMWREKAKLRRQQEKNRKNHLRSVEHDTPASSPSSSRTSVGNAVVKRNSRMLRTQNIYLRKKILELESKMAKYRMRAIRLRQKENKEKLVPQRTYKKVQGIKKAVETFLLQDGHSTLTSGKKDTITSRL